MLYIAFKVLIVAFVIWALVDLHKQTGENN
jgi:hypothetical protein